MGFCSWVVRSPLRDRLTVAALSCMFVYYPLPPKGQAYGRGLLGGGGGLAEGEEGYFGS